MPSGLYFGKGPALTKVGHDIAAHAAIFNDRIQRGTMRERAKRTQNAMKAHKYLGSRRAERRFSRQIRPMGGKKRRGGSKIADSNTAKLQRELAQWKRARRQIVGLWRISRLPRLLQPAALRLLPKPVSMAVFNTMGRNWEDQVEQIDEYIKSTQNLIKSGHP